MADSLSVTYYSGEQAKEKWPGYNIYPLYKMLYEKGKNPAIVYVSSAIDTAGNTYTEIIPPTNKVNNYTSPLSVYLKSSVDTDSGLAVKILGDSVQSGFGAWSFNTKSDHGTGEVACGTWYSIWHTYMTPAHAGTISLYSGATTYFSMATAVYSETHAIVTCPTGKYMQCLESRLATDDLVIGQSGNTVQAKIGNQKLSANYYMPVSVQHDGLLVYSGGQSLGIYDRYDGAVLPSTLEGLYVMW